MENKKFEANTIAKAAETATAAAAASAASATAAQEVQKESKLQKLISSATAKLATKKVFTKTLSKRIGSATLSWVKAFPGHLSRGLLRGLIIAIVLNILANYFWTDLPDTIPTIYGFFNGFLTVGEFLYKSALGGIASIFNGTFFEFGDAMMVELGEMWQSFCTWISSIGF